MIRSRRQPLPARPHAFVGQSSGPVRRSTISFNLQPGKSLSGEAANEINAAIARINILARSTVRLPAPHGFFQQSLSKERS